MKNETEATMRLKVEQDYRKFMSPERKERMSFLTNKPILELTAKEGDELAGIAWMTTNLLRLMDAHTVEAALTTEGLLFQTLMRTQAALMKNPIWRGGEEDISKVSNIISA